MPSLIHKAIKEIYMYEYPSSIKGCTHHKAQGEHYDLAGTFLKCKAGIGYHLIFLGPYFENVPHSKALPYI